MSPKQAAKYALRLVDHFANDPEVLHSKLDELAMQILKAKGYTEFATTFEAVTKWYA